MLSFFITLTLVVLIHISGGDTARNEVFENILILHMRTWFQKNLTEFQFPAEDEKYLDLATNVALRLVQEQAEIEGTVRFVDGGAVCLLMIATTEIDEEDQQALTKATEALDSGLRQVTEQLNNMIRKGILGIDAVAICDKGLLKMCAVFVTANEFLQKYQRSFIRPTTASCTPRFLKKYLDTDMLEDFGRTDLLPMSPRAILEALNHSEQQNGKPGPILNKPIQKNLITRTIIFEGKVNTESPNYEILEPTAQAGLPVSVIGINTIFCAPGNKQSYGIVLCATGHLYIVGSCTASEKIFQASFQMPVEEIRPNPKNSEQELEAKVQQEDTKSGKRQLSSSTEAIEYSDHDAPPEYEIRPTTVGTAKKNDNPAPTGPVDVTEQLHQYVPNMFPRPEKPNVKARGNSHIRLRKRYPESEIPSPSDALFTVVITVQIGLEREDYNKYRLVRIDIGCNSIELSEICTQPTCNGAIVFCTPDENVKWIVNQTLVNTTEFNAAVADGLSIFAETLLAMGDEPLYVNDVSGFFARLKAKDKPTYFGAAAELFAKEDVGAGFVQLTIQLSEY